ncbi:branched-chain amino acid ABC transporter permease [Variovorax sp. PBL-E5]|uniref:branched-chain amino acid ABC transporter permease n=1 Tax=Variovorax sp. PBL-E5 TaxID=434014 RepID=UPI0013181279|nr:branched-chain amino acid ABC transporter permease [Variovorax sp. PBL-E5]VTU22960.1 LIV-I protein H [Variovorax sp. PBL-E5]
MHDPVLGFQEAGRASRRSALVSAVAVLVLLAPLFATGYVRYVATLWMIYAIAAVGLQIPIGLAAIYSFGHSAFMLIGAYAMALAITLGGWPVPLAILAALMLAGIVGALLALPSLRLSGFALAIVTMGASSLFFQSVKVFTVTGGPQGLFLPEIAFVKAMDGRVFYAICALLMVLGLVVARCVEGGRIGRALRASAANPLMAQSFGVHLRRTRTLSFVISAVYGSIAGSLLGLVSGYIAPEAYSPELSIQVFAAVMIGGMARFWGPVLGALFIVLIPELTQSVQNLGAIVYALLFIAVSTVYPGGLQQMLSRLVGQPTRRSP